MLFRSRTVPLADDEPRATAPLGRKNLADRLWRPGGLRRASARALNAGGDLSPAGRYALLTGTTRSVFESALRGDNLPGMVGAAEAVRQPDWPTSCATGSPTCTRCST